MKGYSLWVIGYRAEMTLEVNKDFWHFFCFIEGEKIKVIGLVWGVRCGPECGVGRDDYAIGNIAKLGAWIC